MTTHRYILSGGHRNTNRGGATGEVHWTYGATVRLRDAIVRRGGKAWIIQEQDGDSDRTDYLNGGLQQAAVHCTKLAPSLGPFDAYISMHYNGGASPGFHAIFPDAPTGGVDVKANNPLDVKLCRTVRDKVKATNTVGLLSWTADSPGVMSERETGVGAKGYRLGEFFGTLSFRDTTARVILEAGSIDVARERAFINDPDWVSATYSEAIVNGLEAVFGAFDDDDTGGGGIVYPDHMSEAVARDAFGVLKGPDGLTYEFDPSGRISRFWLQLGNQHNVFPRVVQVKRGSAGQRWCYFANGWIFYQNNETVAPELVGA